MSLDSVSTRRRQTTPWRPLSSPWRPPGRVKARKLVTYRRLLSRLTARPRGWKCWSRSGLQRPRERSTWPMMRGRSASITVIVSWPLLATKTRRPSGEATTFHGSAPVVSVRARCVRIVSPRRADADDGDVAARRVGHERVAVARVQRDALGLVAHADRPQHRVVRRADDAHAVGAGVDDPHVAPVARHRDRARGRRVREARGGAPGRPERSARPTAPAVPGICAAVAAAGASARPADGSPEAASIAMT